MDKRSRTIIAVLAVPTLMIGTDFTGALMLVLPIEKEFGVDITTTQWVLNIYALTFAMGMVTAGRLADMFGRRRLFLLGMVVFTIASLCCAAAPSVVWLIGARALQGVGSAMIWPCVLGIASTSVREDERGIAMGLIIGVIGSGNVVGPIIAGVAGGLGEWRLFYVANVVLGVLSFFLVRGSIAFDSGAGRDEKIDTIGIAVLSLALLFSLYALDVGSDWGWGSARVIGLLAFAGALFVAFPFIEDRVADPLVPPPMMRNSQFLLAVSANGLCIPAIFLLYLYLPQYLHKVLGWSVLASSAGIVPLAMAVAAVSVISGRFYNRLGPRRLLVIGYCVTALGTLAAALIDPAWGYAGLLPAMLLAGAGAAIAVGTSGSAAVGAADASRASLAGAISFMFHLAFGAIGVAAGTAILFGVSAAKLSRGLAEIGVGMSSTNQATLNGAAPGAQASREILAHFAPDTAQRITALMNEAFVSGMRQACWMALALTIVGIVVVLRIRDEKLANADG